MRKRLYIFICVCLLTSSSEYATLLNDKTSPASLQCALSGVIFFMKKPLYDKPAFTIPEQASHLMEYNLTGISRSDLEAFLSNVSYYRLKGYMYPYRDGNKNFVVPDCWKLIESDYIFDQKLRSFLFDCISRVEIAFRSQLLLQMSLAHDSRWYSDSKLFHDRRAWSADFEVLKKNWERSKSDFVKHYNNVYDMNYAPPAWMIFETASFGSVSKYYENILVDSVGRNNFLAYWTLERRHGIAFAGWIKNLVHVRNICAHHDRLFSKSISARPALLSSPLNETWRDAWDVRDNDKVFCTMCILKMLLEICAPRFDFTTSLKDALCGCASSQLARMGFPIDWEKRALFC